MPKYAKIKHDASCFLCQIRKDLAGGMKDMLKVSEGRSASHRQRPQITVTATIVRLPKLSYKAVVLAKKYSPMS